MQILKYHTRATELETLGLRPSKLCLTSPARIQKCYVRHTSFTRKCQALFHPRAFAFTVVLPIVWHHPQPPSLFWLSFYYSLCKNTTWLESPSYYAIVFHLAAHHQSSESSAPFAASTEKGGCPDAFCLDCSRLQVSPRVEAKQFHLSDFPQTEAGQRGSQVSHPSLIKVSC
jgi:hypothetical protein